VEGAGYPPDARVLVRTIKVRGKIFAFLSEDGEKLYLIAESYRAVAPASLVKKLG